MQTFAFNAAQRLSALTNDLAWTTQDLAQTFAYNPAAQIDSATRSGDAYAWSGHYNIDRDYTANGLNQLTNAGGVTLSYDARGNLTQSGSDAFSYASENFLKTGPNGAALAYDPLGRLYQTSSTSIAATRYAYDGLALIAEYDSGNALLRRYVHGPGTDQPIVWYEGSGTSDRRFLMADERGSVVSVTNGSGAVLAINTYDEYGIPGAANLGRFGYTGQTWLPELGLNYYKARMYSPTLGRFLQTDPIGYADGMNWYNYVGSDPVNFTDPSGLCKFTLWANWTAAWDGEAGEYGPWEFVNFFTVEDTPCDSPESAAWAQALAYQAGGFPLPKQCPAVPSPGPGRNVLNRNIERARAGRMNALGRDPSPGGTLVDLVGQSYLVVTSQNYKANPAYPDSARFGNFNFGATFAARGFSLEQVLGFSDSFQQFTTGRSDPSEDIADVTNGFNYAAQGCDG